MNKIEKQTLAGQFERLHIAWKALVRAFKRANWWMILVVLDVIAGIGALVIAAWAGISSTLRPASSTSGTCGLCVRLEVMISATIQQFLNEHPEARVLDLSLTYHWYDEIEAGRKEEEYLELKKYYFQRLYMEWHLNLEQGCYKGCDDFVFDPKRCVGCKKFVAYPYDYVLFHRGRFSPTTMLVQCNGIRIGYGREDWGAERGKPYFVIKLGDRVL